MATGQFGGRSGGPFHMVKEDWATCPYPARLLGIDHGEKTLGLSVTDSMQSVATPLLTIDRKKFMQDMKKLKQVIDDYEVKAIVIGYPVNMDGSEGPRCQSIRDTVTEMKSAPALNGAFHDIWIGLWDERLSTSAVDRFLINEADLSRKRRGEVIDKMAAQHILQGAIDYMTRRRCA